jgi:hypothetical protein
MMHAEPGWDEFLKSHQISYVLLPRKAALAALLSETPEWRPVYSDDVAIVFTRTDQKEDSDRAAWR